MWTTQKSVAHRPTVEAAKAGLYQFAATEERSDGVDFTHRFRPGGINIYPSAQKMRCAGVPNGMWTDAFCT
jgi:hypothetical protein